MFRARGIYSVRTIYHRMHIIDVVYRVFSVLFVCDRLVLYITPQSVLPNSVGDGVVDDDDGISGHHHALAL